MTLISIVFSLTSMIGKSKKKDFHVMVEQDGKMIEPKNGIVNVDKSEFNLVFKFNNPMGLLVNGSFKKKTYELAAKGIAKSKLPGFEETGMAEGLLNKDQEILISNSAPGYWYYENDEQSRFNSTEKKNGKLICKRIIKNFYDVNSKQTSSVKNVKKPLYLVFISYKYKNNIEVELKREWIKINWN